MKKLFSIIIAVTFLFFSFSSFVDAKSRSGSSSKSSYSSKSSSSSTKTTKSSSTTKTKTVKPKTVKSKTTVKPKKITKPKVTIKNPGGKFYKNGSYVPYLMTAAGIYLMYQGMEDDGDPIYVNAETGEEVDDDDLESLGAQEIESIPDFDDDEEEVEYEDDEEYSDNASTNDSSPLLGLIMFIIVIILTVGVFIFIMANRK